ncbi:hypothetical protein A3C95_00515 [Candidatus Kaiserbacteria bacterium RIFCSPHIGHO2_02_FULL_56_30]|nr:MAG: hypothetical protein A3C95_00515 [Candidatus Kaiserbacteria bacterium RIFCSPHIGHO2_02_FULL_56_30]
MSNKRLTPNNFDRSVRHDLRYQHGFDHAELERAKGIMSEAIEHVESKTDTSSGMGSHHYDIAEKFLAKHKDWKRLPSHQRDAITSSLKFHFGISDEPAAE